jgi:uncharacterized metal-binding protein
LSSMERMCFIKVHNTFANVENELACFVCLLLKYFELYGICCVVREYMDKKVLRVSLSIIP